ncbi:hypothetical protein BS17DRAFT_783627, partial [Gyrodon lividus]
MTFVPVDNTALPAAADGSSCPTCMNKMDPVLPMTLCLRTHSMSPVRDTAYSCTRRMLNTLHVGDL